MPFDNPRPRPAFHGPRRDFAPRPGGSASASPAANSRNKNVKQWPQVGEIVVVNVDKVLDYGVFCSLLEYSGATGFVHISQVASSWIKNIRNYVKEGQMRAAVVQKIDFEKLQIDLSLTKVGERQQRLRIEEYKQLKRNQKLIEQMAKTQNKTMEQGWKEIADPLANSYETVSSAFEAISIEGKSALDNIEGLDPKWIPIIVDVVQKNVKVQEKAIRGTITLMSTAPNGVEIIKQALLESPKSAKNAVISITYLGAGKYKLKVASFDFKIAERALSEMQEKMKKLIGPQGTYALARVEE
ncbi:MAG: S1 RNA-binding domain-containing protein [Candidatus Iainarchaeum archaeon]|uniref:S1 RNA-binding domain-containing protein n=1 Tax=Candidatus Iainarchaeum sp. TaxID=3101447 RepID=A0A7T9DJN5_9ARCH|nr:MAG: S1 RNA-binding domain-containing protein [Candidatus Diapherotrites archaeon]